MLILIDFVDLGVVNIYMKWIFFLFAVVFGGVGVGVFFGLILPDYRDANIAKTGTLIPGAEAYEKSSNLTVNDVSYYRIHFRYQKSDGNWKEGKTNSGYTSFQADQIIARGTIDIKVKGNRAVAADFQKAPGTGFLWIFVIVFGGVGVGMGVAFFMLLMVSVHAARIRMRGMEGEGYYIGSSVGMYVNDVPRYKLVFGFKTATGEEHVQKTPTKYHGWQVDELQRMERFKVKYLGTKAIVFEQIKFNSGRAGQTSENFSKSPIGSSSQLPPQSQPPVSKRCEWCGAARENKVCGYCGN